MACLEIEELKRYLERGEIELRAEEENIDQMIDQETRLFFSQYSEEDRDQAMENEFRESLRVIYKDKFNKKRAFLMDIGRKLDRMANDYLTESA